MITFVFTKTKNTFRTSNAQKRVSTNIGSFFASNLYLSIKTISCLCVLLGLCANTTPLMGTAAPITDTIDTGLKIYYRLMGRNDYSNDKNIGKFKELCEVEEHDDDAIKEELDGDIENCDVVDFDHSFPCTSLIEMMPEHIKKKFRIRLCKLFVYQNKKTSLPQAVKQIEDDLLTKFKVIETIDAGLAHYYRLKNRNDYLNDKGEGKFNVYCDKNDFENKTIIENLETGVDDCAFWDFDENFPYPDIIKIMSQDAKEYFLFRLFKWIVASENLDSLSKAVKQIEDDLLTKFKVIETIDAGLAHYYRLKNRNDYLNDKGEGKFNVYCDKNDFENKTIIENLETGVDDCAFWDFDENFPYPDIIKIMSQDAKEYFLFRLFKWIVASENLDSLSKAVKQIEDDLLTKFEVIQKIDAGLAHYYRLNNRYDYFNDKGKGMFMLSYEEKKLNKKTVADLKKYSDNFGIINFDDNFPYPDIIIKITSQDAKEYFLFRLFKWIIASENLDRLSKAVIEIEDDVLEQFIIEKINAGLHTYYQSKGRNDYLNDKGKGKFWVYSQEEGFDKDTIIEELNGDVDDCGFLDFDEDFPLPKQIQERKKEFIFRLLKDLRLRNPTKVCDIFKIREEDVIEFNQKKLDNLINDYKLQLILDWRISKEKVSKKLFYGYLRSIGKKIYGDVKQLIFNYYWLDTYKEYFLKQLTNREDIDKYKDICKAYPFHEPCPGLFYKATGTMYKTFLGFVILDREDLRKDTIKQLARFTKEAKDKSVLGKPVYVLFFKKCATNFYALKALDISIIFDCFVDAKRNYFTEQVKEFDKKFSLEIKKDPYLAKYLQVQWLCTARYCIRYLLFEFYNNLVLEFQHIYYAPPFPEDIGYPKALSIMLKFLINDRLDSKVLMKAFKEMKMEQKEHWDFIEQVNNMKDTESKKILKRSEYFKNLIRKKAKYASLESELNKAIKQKGLVL